MNAKKNPEATNLGVVTETAGSEIDVLPILPRTTSFTEAEAARLTKRIELRLATIADNAEVVVELIEQARAGNADEALGYRSWSDYFVEKFGGTLSRLSKIERLPLVELMAEQGMSTRAIGEVVGVSNATVSRDIAGVTSVTPDVEPGSDAFTVVASATPEQFETALSEARSEGDLSRENVEKKINSTSNVVPMKKTITGVDGKNYVRPEPKPPRRRPLPDSYFDAAYKLEKVVTTLSHLHQDDRFTSNRDSVKRHGGHLARAANELCDLLDDLGFDRHQHGGT